MPRPHPPDEAGQASVELVALLPLIAAVLALAWQAVLAGQAAWAAAAAARAAARAASVEGDAERAARAHLPADLRRGVRIHDRAGREVDVSVAIPAVLPEIRLGRVHGTARYRAQAGTP
jgi:hypothetical protein